MQVQNNQFDHTSMPGHNQAAVPPAPTQQPLKRQGDHLALTALIAPPHPPTPASNASSSLANLLGLSRLQHLMHILQPIRAVVSRIGGAGKMAHAAHMHAGMASAAQGLSPGARFMRGIGGKLGLLSSLVSVPIFWMDYRTAKQTLADSTVSDSDKARVKFRLGLSGLSAGTGAAAIAAAGLGVLFPPALAAVGPFASISGLAGIGSFVASLFGRNPHANHSAGQPGTRSEQEPGWVAPATVPTIAAPDAATATSAPALAPPQVLAPAEVDTHRWHLQELEALLENASHHGTSST